MGDLLKVLKEQKLVSDEKLALLDHNFSGIAKKLFRDISKMHCVNHMALLHTVARDINLGFTQRSMILKQQVVKNFSLNLTRKDQVKC